MNEPPADEGRAIAHDSPTTDVFISYSRSDVDKVVELDAELRALGLATWVDLAKIPKAFDWFDTIKQGIDGSSAFVSVMSPAYVASEICTAELQHAVAGGKRLIPVVAEALPDGSVPEPLARLNWISLTSRGLAPAAAGDIGRAAASDPEWTNLHTRLLLRAQEWADADRRSSALLRGRDLGDAADALRAERPVEQPQASPLHLEFLEASEHGRTKRRRWAGFTAMLTIVAATIAGVVLVGTRQEALRSALEASEQGALADSSELAVRSGALLEDDHDLALLLAAESAAVANTEVSQRALLAAALSSPHLARHLHGFPGQVRGVTLAGDHVVAAGSAGAVIAWSRSTGSIEWAVEGGGSSMLGLDSNDDGSTLVVGDVQGSLQLLDNATGESLAHVPAHSGDVTWVEFSPNGDRIVSTGVDGAVRIWGGRELTEEAIVATDATGVVQGRWDPSGRRLALVHSGGVDVIDTQSGDASVRLEQSDVQAIAWTSDGEHLIAGAFDGSLTRLDVGANVIERAWEAIGHEGPVTGVDVRAGTIVSSSTDRTVRAWAVGSGDSLGDPWIGHQDRILALAADDGAAATGDVDGSVVLWDSAADAGIWWEVPELRGASHVSTDASSSRSAAVLGERVLVFDHARDAVVVEIDVGTTDTTAIALGGEGMLVASGTSDGRVLTWRIDAEEPSGTVVLEHTARITTLRFGRTGRQLAWGADDGAAGVIDAASGDRLGQLPTYGSGVADVAVDAEAQRLVAVGAGNSVFVVDLPVGEHAPTALSGTHTNWIDAVALTPDGNTVISGGSDRRVVAWDLVTGEPTQLAPVHTGRILAAAVDERGSLLATADAGGSLVLWKHESGWQPLAPAIAVPDMGTGVEALGFLGSQQLVVAGAGTTRTIDLDSGELFARVCGVANRSLTPAESEAFGRPMDEQPPCEVGEIPPDIGPTDDAASLVTTSTATASTSSASATPGTLPAPVTASTGLKLGQYVMVEDVLVSVLETELVDAELRVGLSIINPGQRFTGVSQPQVSLRGSGGSSAPSIIGGLRPMGGLIAPSSEQRSDMSFDVSELSGPWQLVVSGVLDDIAVSWPVTGTETSVAAPPSLQPDTTLRVGDEATAGNVTVLLESAGPLLTSIQPPTEDRGYLRVDVTLRAAAEYVVVPALQVMLSDEDGYWALPTLTVTEDGEMVGENAMEPPIAIGPGGQTSVELLFDVPADATRFFVYFEDTESLEVAVFRIGS